MTGLEPKEEDRVENHVAQLTKVIQQLQQIIADLELRTVPNIPQDVWDEREEVARSAVEIIKAFTMECKKLSDHSAQIYEKLTEDPELKALESQLQEAN